MQSSFSTKQPHNSIFEKKLPLSYFYLPISQNILYIQDFNLVNKRRYTPKKRKTHGCFKKKIFVLNMFFRFLMCSPRVFPIASCFHPTCFVQSPPLLTYIGGPKGEALYTFNFVFCDGPIKLAHCKKNKSWAHEAPPTN